MVTVTSVSTVLEKEDGKTLRILGSDGSTSKSADTLRFISPAGTMDNKNFEETSTLTLADFKTATPSLSPFGSHDNTVNKTALRASAPEAMIEA